MTYVESNVLRNETIQERVQLHPIRLVFVWIIVILSWIFFMTVMPALPGLLVIPAIFAIRPTVKFFTTEYVITNKNVIEKYGLIKVHCDEIALDKIENVTVNISFFGRLLGVGDVCIQGANLNSVWFKDVMNPEGVRKCINNAIDQRCPGLSR